MDAPVDLTNLRCMTGNDTEMEKALFEEFISSFEDGLATLQASCNDAAAETWRKQSHALKGIAFNLGAAKLGGLCKNGQDDFLSDAEAKELLLHDLREEYAKVKLFLQALG